MTIGYINAGLIAATAIGQMAGGGGGASMGGGGGGAPSFSGSAALPALPAAAPAKEEKESARPIINVHIYGDVVDHDQFARTLLPYLNKAEEAGVK